MKNNRLRQEMKKEDLSQILQEAFEKYQEQYLQTKSLATQYKVELYEQQNEDLEMQKILAGEKQRDFWERALQFDTIENRAMKEISYLSGKIKELNFIWHKNFYSYRVQEKIQEDVVVSLMPIRDMGDKGPTLIEVKEGVAKIHIFT